MIVRHLWLPGEVRAIFRCDPLARRVRYQLLDEDPEATATQRQAVRNAALGAARRLAREHGVHPVEVEVTP